MKRASLGGAEPRIKRHKPENSAFLFNDTSLRRQPTDLRGGENNDYGYILGRVFMVWPGNGKTSATVLLEVEDLVDERISHRVELVLPRSFMDYLEGAKIQLSVKDILAFALRGSTFPTNDKNAVPQNSAIELEYKDGVAMKVIRSRNVGQNGLIVDTLPEQKPEEESEVLQDWYDPAATAAVPNAAKDRGMSLPRLAQRNTEKKLDESQPPEPNRKIKRKRERARKFHEEKHRAVENESHSATEAIPPIILDVPEIKDEIPTTESNTTAAAPSSAHGSRPLDGKRHFTLPPQGYKTIKEATTINNYYNIIAVAFEMSTPRSTTKDWACSLQIIDPSNCIEEDGTLLFPQPFKVNCFMRYAQWLPTVNPGDVLVLRQLKAVRYGSAHNLVGHNDRFMWAIYDPSAGQFDYGDRGEAPEFEGLAGGRRGVAFSPYYKPGTFEEVAEKRYCAQLSRWWEKSQKYRNENITTYDLANEAPLMPANQPRRGRPHLLIRDLQWYNDNRDYFDCTVEVLYGHANENGLNVYSLYVTDYTINESLPEITSSWCSADMSRLVLKIEMFDKAAAWGTALSVGTYISLRNVRMKCSTGSYLEAKIVEEKIKRLEQNEASFNPHLASLLKRKAEYEEERNRLDGPMEYKLIKDFVPREHSNCLVEVLHIVHDKEEAIYVTDYTVREELKDVRSGEDWVEGLDGAVVKIKVCDEAQIGMTKALRPGQFCTIRKLALKMVATESRFQGVIGGTQRLIIPHKLEANMTEEAREMLRRLRRRKATFKGHSDESAMSRAAVKQSTTVLGQEIIECDRVCDIMKLGPLPCKCNFRARVVAVYPERLEDFVAVRCKQCKRDIPSKNKACIKCNDFEHKFVEPFWHALLRLRRADGEELIVNITNQSAFLKDLPPMPLYEYRSSLKKLRSRMESLLGVNWADSGILEFPERTFTLVAWMNGDERRFDLVSAH